MIPISHLINASDWKQIRTNSKSKSINSAGIANLPFLKRISVVNDTAGASEGTREKVLDRIHRAACGAFI